MVVALTVPALAPQFAHPRPFRAYVHHRPRGMPPVRYNRSADDARRTKVERELSVPKTKTTETQKSNAVPQPKGSKHHETTSKIPVTDDEQAVSSAFERKLRQRERIANASGFIAALDQSGGSTPRALAKYGITDIRGTDKSTMFTLIHDMRTRIMTCDAFSSDRIIGSILFDQTVFKKQVMGLPSATYLWSVKGIVPFLKIDNGLEPEKHGVQLMKPIPELAVTLGKCGQFHEPFKQGMHDKHVPHSTPEELKAFYDHYRDVVESEATNDDIKNWLDHLADKCERYLTFADEDVPDGVNHGVVRTALVARHKKLVDEDSKITRQKAKAFFLGPHDFGSVTDLISQTQSPGDCVFGTKARSVIRGADLDGIKCIVAQQFGIAAQVLAAGLVPIIEPEVAIDCENKADAEVMLRDELKVYLDLLHSTQPGEQLCLKLTLPEDCSLYDEFTNENHHPSVMRVFALSGGYDRKEACVRLAKCRGMTASFSRALTEGLRVDQVPAAFTAALDRSVREIYDASVV